MITHFRHIALPEKLQSVIYDIYITEGYMWLIHVGVTLLAYSYKLMIEEEVVKIQRYFNLCTNLRTYRERCSIPLTHDILSHTHIILFVIQSMSDYLSLLRDKVCSFLLEVDPFNFLQISIMEVLRNGMMQSREYSVSYLACVSGGNMMNNKIFLSHFNCILYRLR